MTAPPASRDLPRITLGVLCIGLMIVASLWVLRPFIAATVWAATVVVATWPMMLALQARLGGRRWLAVTLMTGAMLLLLVVPLALAVSTIVDYVAQAPHRKAAPSFLGDLGPDSLAVEAS